MPLATNLYEEAPGTNLFWDNFFQSSSHKKVLDIVFFTLWGLWKNHNECVFEFSRRNPHSLAAQATELSFNYVITDSKNYPTIPSALTVWSPLFRSLIKINVDTAWDSKSQIAVVAVIARNGNKSILYSSARKFQRTNSVLHAELLAIRIGVELAIF